MKSTKLLVIAGTLGMALPSLGLSAPLTLDVNNAYFSDNGEASAPFNTPGALWSTNGEGTPTLAYTTEQAHGGITSIKYQISTPSNWAKISKDLGASVLSTVDYGYSQWLYVPADSSGDIPVNHSFYAGRPLFNSGWQDMDVSTQGAPIGKAFIEFWNNGWQTATINRGEWAHLQIDFLVQSSPTKDVNLYVDDSSNHYSLLGWVQETSPLSYIQLGGDSGVTGTVYYDDSLVAPALVPEPASLGLLSLAGLGLLHRKRRI